MTSGLGTRLAIVVVSLALAGADSSQGYIPKDLDDALVELDKLVKPADKEKIRKSDTSPTDLHRGLGMSLRNTWGLWADSRLAKHFNGLGIFHPDDMSAIIIESYARRLRGKPLGLEGQVAFYQRYWAEAQATQDRETNRANDAKRRLGKLMLGIAVRDAGAPVLRLPNLSRAGQLRVRYAAPFGRSYLLAARRTLDWRKDDAWYTEPYLLDVEAKTLRRVRVPELERIENAVVIGGRLFVHGFKGNAESLWATRANERDRLPLPPGDGWLRLGTGDANLVALRSNAAYLLKGGKWEKSFESKESLPRVAVPPLVDRGQRLYLRDEGRGEDDKRLWWLDRGQAAPESFDQAVGLVGSQGPRWEFVWSYGFDAAHDLWLAAGSSIGPRSLVRWNAKEGYRVALMNGRPTFDGELLGPLGGDASALDITYVGPRKNGALLLAGNSGLFELREGVLTAIVRFENTAQLVPTPDGELHWDFDPATVLELDGGRFLLCSHWDGVFLVEPRKGGGFTFTQFDDPLPQ